MTEYAQKGLICGDDSHGPWLYEPADDWICCPDLSRGWGFSVAEVATLNDALDMVRHFLEVKSFATKSTAGSLCRAIQYWVAQKDRRSRTDWHPRYPQIIADED